MSCPRNNLLSQNYIFSVSSTTQAKQIINLLLLNHFYPVMSWIDEFEKKATNYSIRSLVMVRNQLPAQRSSPADQCVVMFVVLLIISSLSMQLETVVFLIFRRRDIFAVDCSFIHAALACRDVRR